MSPKDHQPSVTISKATAQLRETALALLLTGQTRSSSQPVQNFLKLASDQNLSLDHLWIAQHNGQPSQAILLVPSPGRAAMAFISPMSNPTRVGIAAQLVCKACSQLNPVSIRLIQAMLDPAQLLESQAFQGAGFSKLAHLVYMHRRTENTTAKLTLNETIQTKTWTPDHRALFAQAILASYEDTLDCPGLIGLRRIDDIIDGHKGSGRFIPELWLTLGNKTDPIAVMLLNMVPQRDAVELVYLGISPPWRGRGWGAKLVSHGLALGHRHGASKMILAVDETNKPAVNLYRRMGFNPNARKLAMILPLP